MKHLLLEEEASILKSLNLNKNYSLRLHIKLISIEHVQITLRKVFMFDLANPGAFRAHVADAPKDWLSDTGCARQNGTLGNNNGASGAHQFAATARAKKRGLGGGLNQVGHVHGHLVDFRVVELLDVVQRALVFLRHEVYGHSLTTETAASSDPMNVVFSVGR